MTRSHVPSLLAFYSPFLQAYAANPSPQTLVDGGVNYFNAMSDDGKWLLVSNDTNSGAWFSDLSLVSTRSPGTPVSVATSAQYDGLPIAPRAYFGGTQRGFTKDSAYALAETNLTLNSDNRWIGYLRSMPVAPPYTSKLLTNGYMADYFAVLGSKILVGDNFQDTDGGSSPSIDIDVVDPASSGGPVNIARAVPGDTAISSEMTQVAYSVRSGAAPGIYVSTLP